MDLRTIEQLYNCPKHAHFVEQFAVHSTSRKTNMRSAKQLGYGYRQKKHTSPVRDYVNNMVQKLSPSCPSSTLQHHSCMPYSLAYYVNCDKKFMQQNNFLATITVAHEPANFSEALKNGKWREAMKQEIQLQRLMGHG